ILKGKLLVKDIVINSSEIMYVCGIVGSLVSFFADLKERELTDLDSINNNVAYNLNTIENSWTTPNLNYLFPQLDYGIDERPKYIENDIEVEPNHWDNSYDFKNYRPALYVKTYLDAIFNGFRYNSTTDKYTQLENNNQTMSKNSYQSSLTASDSFKRLFIPYNSEHLTYNIKGVL